MVNYTIFEPSTVNLNVYNMFGEKARILVDGEEQSEGTYQYSVNTSTLDPGVYLSTLVANDNVVTRKIVIVR